MHPPHLVGFMELPPLAALAGTTGTRCCFQRSRRRVAHAACAAEEGGQRWAAHPAETSRRGYRSNGQACTQPKVMGPTANRPWARRAQQGCTSSRPGSQPARPDTNHPDPPPSSNAASTPAVSFVGSSLRWEQRTLPAEAGGQREPCSDGAVHGMHACNITGGAGRARSDAGNARGSPPPPEAAPSPIVRGAFATVLRPKC
jgi:hypothetical protein